jgi:hypothetical protein
VDGDFVTRFDFLEFLSHKGSNAPFQPLGVGWLKPSGAGSPPGIDNLI